MPTLNESFMLDKIKINVNSDHRFGTDAFLLADFAKPTGRMTVCDLCTGCGIIPLIFAKHNPPKKIYAIDIQKEAIDLLKQSISDNNLQDRIFPIFGDLKSNNDIPRESCDMVTVNPPYWKAGTGEERLSKAQAIARHELLCNIGDVVFAAAKALKYGGNLKLCQLPERIPDIICAMRANNIEPKIMTFVCNKQGDKPWLVLISGKKGGKPGLTVGKPLVMRSDEKTYTDRLLKAYE